MVGVLRPLASNFLDQNYRHKSAATQIPHDDGLALLSCTGRKILPHQEPNVVRLTPRDHEARTIRL